METIIFIMTVFFVFLFITISYLYRELSNQIFEAKKTFETLNKMYEKLNK